MMGLVWKDFLALRKTLLSYALFMVLYGGMSLVNFSAFSAVNSFLTVMVEILPLSAFACDERCKWDSYAMALPLGRRGVVGARYLFALSLTALSAVFAGALCLILGLTASVDVGSLVGTLLATMGVGLLIADILFPLCYRFGTERARLFLFAVVFIPLVIFTAAFIMGWFSSLDLAWLEAMTDAAALRLLALIPLAGLVGMVASYLVSCRIVEKKNF